MSVDIERVVVFDETTEAIEDIMPKSRVIIMLGDDGFASVEQTEWLKSGRRKTRIGLTPDMLKALRYKPAFGQGE